MNDKLSPALEQQPVVILTTQRLILRSATERDIPVLYDRIFRDSDVMRYVFAGAPMDKDEAEGFVRKSFTFGNSRTGIATLTERSTGEIVGFAGLFPCDALGTDDFEIGFVLARRVWGKGIATEIGEAQLSFGFGQLNCERLLGLVDPRNTPSINALKKLGMRHLKEVTDAKRANRSVYIIHSGEWHHRQA
jgi:ribosomal-protein-alanine N-acetyltransferase